MDNFREIRPTRNRSRADVSDMVRVSFPQLKSESTGQPKHTMILYLGKKVAEKVGIIASDKIKFYVDLDNPRIWLIKKSQNDVGYKLLDLKRLSGKAADAFRFQMTWKEFQPSEADISLHKVDYEIYQDGIKVIL
jgi:hypothetical protein